MTRKTTRRTTRHQLTGKPISYHPCLDDSFDVWASASGWDSQSLRQAGEQAIGSRHHEAVLEHESRKARDRTSDVFTLSLGTIQVFYTVESSRVMIRGYGWEITDYQLDDYDRGGFYV